MIKSYEISIILLLLR